MTVDSHYTDSESEIKTQVAPEQWKAVGDLARALVRELADRRAAK